MGDEYLVTASDGELLALTTVVVTTAVVGAVYVAPAAAGSVGLQGGWALAAEGALTGAADYLALKGAANVASWANDGGQVAPITASGLATSAAFGAVAGPLANKVGSLFSGAARRVLPNAADKLDTFLQRWSQPKAPFASPRVNGAFVDVSESMSAIAARYQSQVTGTPVGQAFVTNGVKFDGFKAGQLLGAILKSRGWAELKRAAYLGLN